MGRHDTGVTSETSSHESRSMKLSRGNVFASPGVALCGGKAARFEMEKGQWRHKFEFRLQV
eukprot:6380516-Amphidinium_carterae.1